MTIEISDDALFTVPETGGIIKQGVTSVYGHINAGRLEALKLGKNTRITGKAIKKLIASLPSYPASENAGA